MYSNIVTTLLVIGMIVWIVLRQLRPKPVKKLFFIVLPLIALYEVYQTFPRQQVPVTQWIECILVVVAALIAGTIQAWHSKVYIQNHIVYVQGTTITLITWASFILTRIALGFAFGEFATGYHRIQWILWVGIAVIFATRSLILYAKFPEIKHVFAPSKVNG
ncbi:hypothetical protein QCD85_14855 [Paenibacillus sp. PsM32]|uniref:hypothetical protein n=1 Tax=Paenibacillus sp. PsM32 TaxID=3030536 RepID=UPI00263AD3D1|nr:hypothetical protein [Paenibacillus sp. PsM32]MDN4619385.1 hypothetical protein [Paenibacillus sp. PsM32]